MSTEIAVTQQRGRPFKPGQSGNPKGRPKGARNRATLAAEALLDGEADGLTRKAIELGLAGDTAALRLCLERILPPRKERPVPVRLPMIQSEADAARALNEVLGAVSRGVITIQEAAALTELVETCQRAVSKQQAPPSLPPVVNIQFVRPHD